MTFARARYLVVGIAAGLGSALWFNGIAPPIGLTAGSSGASTIIQAFAVVVTAAVAMLATVISSLVASDWQADVQSQQAWAQLRLTPAELSLPVDPRPAWDIDPRYLVPADNEALRQVFRAHRFARPETVDQGIADVPVGIRATRVVPASAEPSPAQRTRTPRRSLSVTQRTTPESCPKLAHPTAHWENSSTRASLMPRRWRARTG